MLQQQQKQHTTYLAREVVSANTFFLAFTQEHGGYGSVTLDRPPSLSPSALPPTKLGPGPPTSLTSTCARSSLCLDKTNTQDRYNRSRVASMHAKTLQTWFDYSRAHIFFASFFCGTLQTCIMKRWTVTFTEPCFFGTRRRPLPSLTTRIRRLRMFLGRSYRSTMATTSTQPTHNIPYKRRHDR